ncbi:MAG: translation initiation factor IF-2 subunit beta [Promethearchaeota archaeon]
MDVDFFNYDELLNKAKEQVPPDIYHHKRFEIPPVDLFIEGNRTVVQNWKDIVTRLNRTSAHLLKFLTRELATAGSIDGPRAIFQGKFSKNFLNDLIERYTKRYVICPTCTSPDTVIVREGTYRFIKCEACGAKEAIPKLK